MAQALIIDDDKMVCEALSCIIRATGFQPESTHWLKKGLELAATDSFDLVFLDINLPDGNGLEAISDIKRSPSSPEVVIITGEGSVDGAELAIKSGSWDYIQKPLSVEHIRLLLSRVFQFRQEKSAEKSPPLLKRDGIVGSSPEINHCLDLVARAAATDANVLITGETGTGKEAFARAIHENSRRHKHNFVVVDCAALPENLIESILFGHEKGAFTGAHNSREGLVKEADRGTLFLDEVGELPLAQQKTFLRVLQEHKFRPVGGNKDVSSDFRLIAATNRSIETMIKMGTFREDLLFRLQTVTLHLPPLRERSGDIQQITSYTLSKLLAGYGLGPKGYSPEFLEAILKYSWPGNVRELIHALENALSESHQEPILHSIHLPVYIRSQLAVNSVGEVHREVNDIVKTREVFDPFPTLKQLVESAEKKYFQDLIECTEGNISQICRISGLSRSNVYTRFKKFHLSKSLS